MQNFRKIFITLFSIAIILFGIIGAAASIAGIFILDSQNDNFQKIQDLGQVIGESLELTSGLLKDTNTTSEHIAESIRATKKTIKYTSVISYDSGIAFEKMSDLVGFEIIGFKPLEGAEDYFKDIGNNLVGLSEELDSATVNMETNASDLDKISGNLEVISVKLDDVALRFNDSINLFSIYNLARIIKYLLVYLVILNIIFILNGIIFLALGSKS